MRRSQQELITILQRLRAVTPPTEWVTQSRELLLQEIRRQANAPVPAVPAFDRPRESLAAGWLRLFRQPVVGLVAALALALGSALTVNAAFYSLPGEPLYRLKLAFERTQLVLVSDSTRKAELKVEFVRNRVKELEQLVAQVAPGRTTPQRVSQVVTRFTREVAAVRQEIGRLPAGNRAVFKIAVSVDEARSDLAAQLQAVTQQPEAASAEVTAVVREALAAAEQTSQSALEAAIAAPTSATSSQALPAADVSRFLEEKVAALREQLASRAAPAPPAVAEALDAASAAITEGAFAAALEHLKAAKTLLDQGGGTPQSAAPEANVAEAIGTDQPATSTADGVGATAEFQTSSTVEPPVQPPTGGTETETTQNFLP